MRVPTLDSPPTVRAVAPPSPSVREPVGFAPDQAQKRQLNGDVAGRTGRGLRQMLIEAEPPAGHLGRRRYFPLSSMCFSLSTFGRITTEQYPSSGCFAK
jgi:hypothetical protein